MKLEQEGVISPTDISDWGRPVVLMIKNDGSLKLCGDYRVTINKHLKKIKYPLPPVVMK